MPSYIINHLTEEFLHQLGRDGGRDHGRIAHRVLFHQIRAKDRAGQGVEQIDHLAGGQAARFVVTNAGDEGRLPMTVRDPRAF